jgi:uncharacterized protein YjbI with pentapeptide repeats
MRRPGAFLVAFCLVALCVGGAGATIGDAPPCEPGSGPNLTHTDVSAKDLQAPADVRCADLAGAYLKGLDMTQDELAGANLQGADLQGAELGQADLAGANLKGANLEGADLVQTTLTSANLDGADISHSKLIQLTGNSASFVGANLTGDDLTQAELHDADFDHAKLGGTDFTQASIGGATFHGATGITNWSLYIAILAGVVLVLLLWGARRALTRGGAKDLVLGLLGVGGVALGVHLFFGGVAGAVGQFGAPIRQTCSTGPLCSVGVEFGPFGIFLGIFAIIAGVGMLVASRSGSS